MVKISAPPFTLPPLSIITAYRFSASEHQDPNSNATKNIIFELWRPKASQNWVWATYPSVSSASVFHNRDIGNGVASVTENSLTLNAGERIAH